MSKENRDINILVVDDEREIADLVEIYLKNEGYGVIKLYDSTKAMDVLALGSTVQLALIDVMMPGIDGMTLCSLIRGNYNMPIIMLTAKSGDDDKISGLTAGADDYITKPFNPDELIARVKAQLRRFINLNPNKNEGSIIDAGGLVIDKDEHSVNVYGVSADLTPMEFDILCLLAENPGKVFSAEEIFTTVWQEKYLENSNNTVMVHIRHIREKIGDSGKTPRFIKTVWGVGYKMNIEK